MNPSKYLNIFWRPKPKILEVLWGLVGVYFLCGCIGIALTIGEPHSLANTVFTLWFVSAAPLISAALLGDTIKGLGVVLGIILYIIASIYVVRFRSGVALRGYVAILALIWMVFGIFTTLTFMAI